MAPCRSENWRPPRYSAGADSPRESENNRSHRRRRHPPPLVRTVGNSSTRTRISDGSRQPPASIPAHLWQGAIPESAPLADQGGAFSTLPNALEGTQMGRRDKLVIRLGLAGVRAQEIVGLQIGDLRDLDTDHPSLHWTGKRYKPLHIAHGPHTVVALRRYLADHREQSVAIPRPMHGSSADADPFARPGPASSPRPRNGACLWGQRSGKYLEPGH